LSNPIDELANPLAVFVTRRTNCSIRILYLLSNMPNRLPPTILDHCRRLTSPSSMLTPCIQSLKTRPRHTANRKTLPWLGHSKPLCRRNPLRLWPCHPLLKTTSLNPNHRLRTPAGTSTHTAPGRWRSTSWFQARRLTIHTYNSNPQSIRSRTISVRAGLPWTLVEPKTLDSRGTMISGNLQIRQMGGGRPILKISTMLNPSIR